MSRKQPRPHPHPHPHPTTSRLCSGAFIRKLIVVSSLLVWSTVAAFAQGPVVSADQTVGGNASEQGFGGLITGSGESCFFGSELNAQDNNYFCSWNPAYSEWSRALQPVALVNAASLTGLRIAWVRGIEVDVLNREPTGWVSDATMMPPTTPQTVAVSPGGWIAVGSPDVSQVHLYKKVVLFDWQLQETLTGNPAERYGAALDFSPDGETLVIGAPGTDTSGLTGRVERRQRSGNSWIHAGDVWDPAQEVNNLFGAAVALGDNDTLVVGAPGQEYVDVVTYYDFGAVFVFEGPSATTPAATLVWPHTGGPSAHAGAAVDILGDVLVFGAPGASNIAPGVGSLAGAGHAEIYRRDAGAGWVHAATLAAESPQLGANLGQAVALAGTTALAGAPGAASGQGEVSSFHLANVLGRIFVNGFETGHIGNWSDATP